jgi:hypothetical protein
MAAADISKIAMSSKAAINLPHPYATQIVYWFEEIFLGRIFDMVSEIVIAAAMFAALFLLFLVLSKAMGGIDNCFYKLEYLIRKECDLKLEGLETKYKKRAADKKFDEMYSIRRVSDDDAAKGGEGAPKAADGTPKTADAAPKTTDAAPKAANGTQKTADAAPKAADAKNKAANGNG